MRTITLETIHKDLESLKRDVAEIKEHMVDVDIILTPEEENELDKSIENYKKGKTKDFDRIKDELGL